MGHCFEEEIELKELNEALISCTTASIDDSHILLENAQKLATHSRRNAAQ